MEEPTSNLEAEIVGIHFSLATTKEIHAASVSGCPVSHSSQLTNPYLGLPLENGRCESCGTSEIGKCEGHFGYIELPVPVYHPSYVTELKQVLNLLCLKCLKIKNQGLRFDSSGFPKKSSVCCKQLANISVREVKKSEGALFLELRASTKDVIDWSFLKQYGFSYGDDHTRTLLPAEAMEIIKRIPEATIMKLRKKGYFPQNGYILRSLPVPPNCLNLPKISDGITVFSSDVSIIMLRKVLRLVENIKKSRSGVPTFESHEAEATELQSSVFQYLQVRGVGKTDNDKSRYGWNKDVGNSAATAWIQKIRDLFIRKGSGFSSRSVITGDTFIQVNEIGIPVEIAERIAFEEIVSVHNQEYLQKLVDDKQCLGFKEGTTLYSLKEGSKGHTSLNLGQIVLRAIKDGDVVFVNRPPTTHKHALQAFRVFIHEDHTVKVNPLICGPLSADFDGDCIHLFYPQSVASRAEVLELFSLEKQLLSSHNGNLLLQLTTDAVLSLRGLLKEYTFLRPVAQDLILHACAVVQDSISKLNLDEGELTVLHILQACLPENFDCFDGKLAIKDSVIIGIDPNRDVSSTIDTILETIYFEKGANAVLLFLNSLQPLLMEYLYSNGYCFGLNDFCVSKEVRSKKQEMLNIVSSLLFSLRSEFNEIENLLVKYYIKHMEAPIVDYFLNSSSVAELINSKSTSAMNKIIQQTGFLGLQIAEQGSFYSKNLVEELSLLFERKHPHSLDYRSAKFGFVINSLFDGLDPYEAVVHSTSSREVTLRSSQGLSEPGALFKNLMAVLRDVVVCYDGTVRNISSNSIIQFEYATMSEREPTSLFCPGEPVGVLAATALSNPAYKAVLDSSLDSNSTWNLMKEILRCSVSFKNNLNDRRVILYLNDCGCGENYCLEKTAYTVKFFLERVQLKNVVDSFWIEYLNYNPSADIYPPSGLCGHIHMNMDMLESLNTSLDIIQSKCEERLNFFGKKKRVGAIFKMVRVDISDTCSSKKHESGSPCLKFWLKETVNDGLQRILFFLSDHIFPVLSETTIKGDDKISSVNVISVNPGATAWVRNPSKANSSEIAVQIILEKSAVKHRGDSWRVAMNCCLPILHLIDTNRSIPYTVKEIQELVGISSAFEQAVQRLSSSISTVSKGVLQEHLILVANTMTCSGTMVGFNTGGYKSISRAFNLQEPFAEATLSAPKKCFERSAGKCHVDKLSSVVAACSWGKQVSVGTGSSFEILWEDNQRCFKQESVSNPYEYLKNVCYGNSGEPLSSFIDPDADELMDGKRDWSPSPCEKASFRDSNSWLEKAPEILNGWGSGTKDEQKQCSWDELQSENASAWGSNHKDSELENTGWGANDGIQKSTPLNTNASNDPSLGAWGSSSKESELENTGWGTNDGIQKPTSWNSNTLNDPSIGAWGSSSKESELENTDWGTNDGIQKPTSWNSNTSNDPESQISCAWGSSGTETALNNVQNNSNWNANTDPSPSAWDSNSPHEPESQVTSAWGSSAKEKGSSGEYSCNETAPPTFKVQGSSGTPNNYRWNSMANAGNKQTPKDNDSSNFSGWKAKSSTEPASHITNAWGSSNSNDGGNIPSSWDTCSKESELANNRDLANWNSDPPNEPSSSAWGSSLNKSPLEDTHNQNPPTWNTADKQNTASWDTESPNDAPSWTANQSNDVENTHTSLGGWKSLQTTDDSGKWVSENPESSDWSSEKKIVDENAKWRRTRNEREPRDGWEKREYRKREELKDQTNADRVVMRTETGKPVHIFTTEEQPVLADVEQLVRSIRKIMHFSGYKDEDPLSEEDRSFIVEKVLNFHQQKAEKIGEGIDHLTVSRSAKFPETRCFYVVTSEGNRNDFSYLKCVDSYVRGKFPDAADDFLRKYFGRRAGAPSVAVEDPS